MHGTSYGCSARIRVISLAVRAAVVLRITTTSSACSTLPCQRYTERIPGSRLAQAARRSSTTALAMAVAVARSGQVTYTRRMVEARTVVRMAVPSPK